MSNEEHKALVRRAVDAFNRGELDAIPQLFAADYVDHDPSRADLPPGPDGVRQAWTMMRAAFPDLEATIDDLVAEGDKVAVRGGIHGTHDGELMSIPPTGKRVTVTLIDFNRIRDGMLAERWAQADTLGLLQQIGVIPGPTADARDEASARGRAAAVVDADPEANKALTRRYADLLLNRHELERAPEILATDFVGHFAGAPGPVRGVPAWQGMFGGFLAAFPDYRETVHDLLAEGDLVAGRITFTGTHRGNFLGLPPTSRTIECGGMAFLRIAGGRVVEQWTEADLLGLLRQLGALPAPAQHGEA